MLRPVLISICVVVAAWLDLPGMAQEPGAADTAREDLASEVFEDLVQGAVRGAVLELGLAPDSAIELFQLDLQAPDVGESETPEVITLLHAILRSEELLRSIDEQRSPEAAARNLRVQLERAHERLKASAAEFEEWTATSLRRVVADLIGRIGPRTRWREILVPTEELVGLPRSTPDRVSLPLDHAPAAAIAQLVRHCERGGDATQHGAWGDLRHELMQFLEAHAGLGLAAPTPGHPLVVASPTEFARLVRDAGTLGERTRFVEYAHFALAPGEWIQAHQSEIIDPRLAGLRSWQSAEDILHDYMNHVLDHWHAHAGERADGSITQELNGLLAAGGPIATFGPWLEKNLGESYVRMRLWGAYAAQVGVVAARRLHHLLERRSNPAWISTRAAGRIADDAILGRWRDGDGDWRVVIDIRKAPPQACRSKPGGQRASFFQGVVVEIGEECADNSNLRLGAVVREYLQELESTQDGEPRYDGHALIPEQGRWSRLGRCRVDLEAGELQNTSGRDTTWIRVD